VRVSQINSGTVSLGLTDVRPGRGALPKNARDFWGRVNQ
jgi:hypothetical protein